jgi:hypothetical protein
MGQLQKSVFYNRRTKNEKNFFVITTNKKDQFALHNWSFLVMFTVLKL